MLAAAGLLIATELATPCPRGGPLAFGDCARVRPFVVGVVAVSAVLYVAALSAVRWWVIGLARRGVADVRAVRDWYVLAAVIGLAAVPLFTFTTLSALR